MKGQYKMIGTQSDNQYLYLARKELTLDYQPNKGLTPLRHYVYSNCQSTSRFLETKRGKFCLPKSCLSSPKSHSFHGCTEPRNHLFLGKRNINKGPKACQEKWPELFGIRW